MVLGPASRVKKLCTNVDLQRCNLIVIDVIELTSRQEVRFLLIRPTNTIAYALYVIYV